MLSSHNYLTHQTRSGIKSLWCDFLWRLRVQLMTNMHRSWKSHSVCTRVTPLTCLTFPGQRCVARHFTFCHLWHKWDNCKGQGQKTVLAKPCELFINQIVKVLKRRVRVKQQPCEKRLLQMQWLNWQRWLGNIMSIVSWHEWIIQWGSNWFSILTILSQTNPTWSFRAFSQTFENFLSKFYTSVMRSYLCSTTNFDLINCNFGEVVPC